MMCRIQIQSGASIIAISKEVRGNLGAIPTYFDFAIN